MHASQHATSSCNVTMPHHHAMSSFHIIMPCHHATSACHVTMPHQHAISTCYVIKIHFLTTTLQLEGVPCGTLAKIFPIGAKLQNAISFAFRARITIGLIHSNSSTSSMIPASSMQSNSSFTFSLYLGFSLYRWCLLGLASGHRGIFISPRSPTIPFIYEKLRIDPDTHAISMWSLWLSLHPNNPLYWQTLSSLATQCLLTWFSTA